MVDFPADQHQLKLNSPLLHHKVSIIFNRSQIFKQVRDRFFKFLPTIAEPEKGMRSQRHLPQKSCCSCLGWGCGLSNQKTRKLPLEKFRN